MTRTKFLVVLLCCLCIVMGLKPRGQAHELISGKLGQTMSHDLKQGGQQHKLAYQQYHQDEYSQQTTPGDQSTTSSYNDNNVHKPSSSLLTTQKNQQHNGLFGGSDSESTTHDGKGYHEHDQMSSYDHYYGGNGHKMLRNRQHLPMQQGEGGLRDEYSMMGVGSGQGNGDDDYDDDNNGDNYYNHKVKKHLQNDYDEPNNGQRTYYVDDNALRQGLRQQDTSSVKVRDYVDYNKQLTGSPVVRPDTGSTVIIRHNLGDIDTGSSGSSASNHDKVFYQEHKEKKSMQQHQRIDDETTSSSSVQLHDPNDDQYIIKHMVDEKQVHEQGGSGAVMGSSASNAGMQGSNTGMTGVNGMNGDNYNNNDNDDNDDYNQYHKTGTTSPQTQTTTTMTSTGNSTPLDRPTSSVTTTPSTTTTTTSSTTTTDDNDDDNND